MNFNKGSGLVALLITLSLFSFIFLTISQWGNLQRQRAINIYQSIQALQIAENQKQRQLFNLPCETQVKQNQITFQVHCQKDKVSLRYPSGEISL